MDPTVYTLLVATSGALCAAFIAGWLLVVAVPVGLFCAITVTNVLASVLGSVGPWYWSTWHRTARSPLNSIVAAMFLATVLSCLILVLDHVVVRGIPVEDLATHRNLRNLISVCSSSLSTSLSVFLLHYHLLHAAPEIRRVFRRVKKVIYPGPEPQLVMVDSLEAEAPGECAICLDSLANLPAELAHASPATRRRMPDNLGLLRYQCGHTFHAVCAEHWMRRELICPLCRRQVGSLGSCHRICLHPQQHVTPSSDDRVPAVQAV